MLDIFVYALEDVRFFYGQVLNKLLVSQDVFTTKLCYNFTFDFRLAFRGAGIDDSFVLVRIVLNVLVPDTFFCSKVFNDLAEAVVFSNTTRGKRRGI